MRQFKLLLLLIIFVGAGATRAYALVGVEVKYWRPDIDTEAKSSTDALTGDTIDLDSDLDLDSKDNVPFVKIWLGGKHRIVGSWMRIKLDGEAAPDVEFNFGGETFTVAAEVETDLEIDIYRLAWETDWVSGDGFRLGTIFGTEIFDAKVSVESDLVGSEEVDIKAPVPIVGLQGEIGLPWSFAAYGEIAGVWIDSGSFEGGFIEWEAGLKYKLVDKGPVQVYACVGFRQLKINMEDDDEKGRREGRDRHEGLHVRRRDQVLNTASERGIRRGANPAAPVL